MAQTATPDLDGWSAETAGHFVSRRALLVGAAAAAVGVRPAAARAPRRRRRHPPPPPLQLDDASRLNRIAIARHWRPAQVTGDAWLDALRAELKAAASQGRPVSVGSARHSMGGQALPRDGVAMTFDVNTAASSAWIEPNREARTYRVAAGARWSQVIRALDPLDFSPAVMQSNADFGTAATLCVNAHGWPVPFGPFGATARSFRLMLASGEVLTCSSTENAELFGLVNGGYGLLVVVVDRERALVENALLRPTHELMPADKLGPRMAAAIAEDATIRMAYGRLAVDAERFLREALLVTYRLQAGTPPPARSGGLVN